MEDLDKSTFIQLVVASIKEQDFIKLTLSKANKRDNSLAKNIYGRLVQLKKGLALSCTIRYETQDMVKNYMLGAELENFLEDCLAKDYLIATLLTTTEDIVLKYNKKRKGRILRTKVKARTKLNIEAHNVDKQYAIPLEAPFLHKLGITNKEAKLTKSYQDKYKQINKYIEIMSSLLKQANLLNRNLPLQIVDMGAGKGYLTFALHSYLKTEAQI